MSKKGRYNEDESKVGADKRRLENLENDGKPWTQADLCKAYTMWLDEAGDVTIANAVGRSLRSMDTFFPSKVCNPDKHLRGMLITYQGESRTKRKVYWTDRDDAVLKLCLKAGRSMEVIAAMLGREVQTIMPHVNRMQNRGNPSLLGDRREKVRRAIQPK